VPVGGLLQGKGSIDDRPDLAGLDQLPGQDEGVLLLGYQGADCLSCRQLTSADEEVA
jgi:hypothetical protein